MGRPQIDSCRCRSSLCENVPGLFASGYVGTYGHMKKKYLQLAHPLQTAPLPSERRSGEGTGCMQIRGCQRFLAQAYTRVLIQRNDGTRAFFAQHLEYSLAAWVYIHDTLGWNLPEYWRPVLKGSLSGLLHADFGNSSVAQPGRLRF